MSLDYDKHLLPAYARAFAGRPRPNRGQRDGIICPSDSLVLVAGPGSGKTTVLALRILTQIFCDQVPPNSILATTLTVKAAAELGSRVLGWGLRIIDALKSDLNLSPKQKAFVDAVDINRFTPGRSTVSASSSSASSGLLALSRPLWSTSSLARL